MLSKKYTMKLINKIFLFLSIVCLLFLFLTFIRRCIIIITYPFDIDNIEGYVLNEAKVLISGGNIYKDINNPPFLFANYPPVYQFVTGLVMKIFNSYSFFIPRIVSFICSITIMLMIFYIVFQYSKNILISIISGFIFPAMWYVYEWTPYARIDLLGILFSVLAIISVKNLYVCILFSTLAVFTKQTFVFTAIVCFIYLTFYNKKDAKKFIIYYFSICGIIAIFINFLTKGEFIRQIIFSNVNPYNLKATLRWFNGFQQNYFLFIIFAIYNIIQEISQKKISIYSIYFVFSIITATFVGHIGAYANYFLELSVAISILTGFTLTNLSEKKYNFFVYVLFFLQIIYLLKLEPNLKLTRKHNWSREPTKEELRIDTELFQFINENKEKNILKETKPGMLVLANKKVEYHSFLPALGDLWNSRSFIQSLQNGRYDIVITEKKQFNYDNLGFLLKKKIGNYYIYEYAKKP